MVAYSRIRGLDTASTPYHNHRCKIFRPWEDREDSDEESSTKNHSPNTKCCGMEFKKTREYKRHKQATARHGHPTEKCPECPKVFTRKDNLTRHRKMKHESEEKPQCSFCLKPLSRRDAVQRHEGTCHNNPKRQPSSSSPSPMGARNRNSESPKVGLMQIQIQKPIVHPIPYRYLKTEHFLKPSYYG